MIFRGLFLFPYVAPVIAMAFTWLVLLDPNSGALNALLLQMGAIETPINFFGIRWTEVELFGLNLPIPLALLMVIAFEVWRYFPLSFLSSWPGCNLSRKICLKLQRWMGPHLFRNFENSGYLN